MKIKLFTFLLFIAISSIYGQVPTSPQTILSPNASNLGLYGEIPVSHFTGIPSIQVPLYELRIGNVNLPLSLSYHAAGIRPDQHPSWTGLGWSLNVGGVISRIVKDRPDEYNNSKYAYGAKAGYYFNYSVLDKDNWNQRSYLREVAQTDAMAKDTEPDEFSFNFLGYHGKFMLTHKKEWKVQCDKAVKVEFSENYLDVPFKKDGTLAQTYGYFRSFAGFTLTTEDGTQYVFGGNVNTIDYSIDFFSQYQSDWIATSWNLTKIKYTDGDEVIFSYERDDFVNQMFLAVHHDLGSSTESSGGIFNPQPGCSSWSITSIEASYQGKLISPVYLKSVSLPNASISFTREETRELRYSQEIYRFQRSVWNNSSVRYPFLGFLLKRIFEDDYPQCLDRLKWYKLSNMSIRNNKNELIRKFNFSYNDLTTQRLMLKSVTEYGIGAEGRSYHFEYNKPELLPAYLSNMTDHWGFYNNRMAYLDHANYYSYREPNKNVLQYGILEKIIYPTGGYTRFVFEPHDYRKQVSFNRWERCEELAFNKVAGGVRIKKIINSSTGNSAEEACIKEYYYVSDYLLNRENSQKSSGVLGGQVQYSFSNYTVFAFNDKDVRFRINMFSSESVLPCCENSLGSHIGYTEVVEKRGDGTFTRHQYTNFDNGHMDESADAIIQESRSPYEPYNSKAVERGHLILQEDYAPDGGIKKMKRLEYERSTDNFIRSMKATWKNICPATAVSYDEGVTNRIYMYNYRVIKEEETIYDDSLTPVTIASQYLYNNSGFPKEVTKTINNGIKKTTYKRPDDYSTGIYTTMVAKHVISPIIEETESYIGNNGLIKQLKKTLFNYTLLENISDRFFALSSVKEGLNDNLLKETYVCHDFDAKGNPVYMTIQEQKIIYLWGYNYRYVVAKINNATLAEVLDVIGPLDTFSRADTPELSKLNFLRKQLSQSQMTSYLYTPLVGLTSTTDPQGKETYFQYDSLGRLIMIRDEHGNVEKAYDYKYFNAQ